MSCTSTVEVKPTIIEFVMTATTERHWSTDIHEPMVEAST